MCIRDSRRRLQRADGGRPALGAALRRAEAPRAPQERRREPARGIQLQRTSPFDAERGTRPIRGDRHAPGGAPIRAGRAEEAPRRRGARAALGAARVQRP
eukprot:4734235-Prymnesium_polylepis.1